MFKTDNNSFPELEARVSALEQGGGGIPSPSEDDKILVSENGEWKESNTWNMSLYGEYDLSISPSGFYVKYSATQQPIVAINHLGVYFLGSNSNDAITITEIRDTPVVAFLGNHAGGILYVDATD